VSFLERIFRGQNTRKLNKGERMKLNTIYNEDCILGIKEKIKDKSVDLILTDLPYGVTSCKWDIIIPFDKLWEQYNRILKDDGVVVLTSTQPFTTSVINSNRKMFKYCWYWLKIMLQVSLLQNINQCEKLKISVCFIKMWVGIIHKVW